LVENGLAYRYNVCSYLTIIYIVIRSKFREIVIQKMKTGIKGTIVSSKIAI